MGITLDNAGNIYIAQDGDGVRKVSSPSGIISTVVSSVGANGIASDNVGNLYLATGAIPSLRYSSISGYPPGGITRISSTGSLATIAGHDIAGYSGDGGPAANAQVTYPSGVAVDTTGNVYIAEAGNLRVRKVSASGTITTVAGNGSLGYSGDGGPATSTQLRRLTGIATDALGNVFFGDYYRVRKVTPAGTITTIAGNGTQGDSGDGGPATNAQIGSDLGLTVDTTGNLYIADERNYRVRKVSPVGVITAFAGNGISGSTGDGGPATNANLAGPSAVALDGSGNLYINDFGNIRRVSPGGIITTVVSGEPQGISGIAVDSAGNLYLSESCICSSTPPSPVGIVRKISTTGTATTVGGNGTIGYSGDGGPATSAQMGSTLGLAVARTPEWCSGYAPARNSAAATAHIAAF